MVFIHGCKASTIFENQSNTPHDMIVPISTERSSGKIQHKLIKKKKQLWNTGILGHFLILIKRAYRGMEWGGRREEGSGWGTHVYLWQIHFDIWQN